MKKVITACVFFIIGLTSCNKEIRCIQAEGEIVNEERYVSNFTEVEVNIDADVEIIESDSFGLEVSGYENVLNHLITNIEGQELRIHFDVWCVRKNSQMKIKIYMPILNRVRVSGSGDVLINGVPSNDQLTLRLSGSGKVRGAHLVANRIDAEISGSGNLKLDSDLGVDHLEAKISGSGCIKAFTCKVNDANIKVSGSGKMEVNIEKQLTVKIAGSGSVYYMGSPVINTSITGSGKLIQK